MAKYALCIGINDYPGTGSDLAGCVNDANDWSEALSQRGFEVAQLLDSQATKSAMVSGIEKVIKAAKSAGDVVVVQYSGHGSYILDRDGDETDGTDEVLCPHDIGQNRPLSDDELHDLFGMRTHGVRAVLIADSCHSGTVARIAAAAEREAPRIRFLPPSTFVPQDEARIMRSAAPRNLWTAPKRYNSLLLAGCQDTEYSYDAHFNGRPNGAFTHTALEALKTLAQGATYRDWFRKIRQALPSQSYPQRPNLFGSTTQKKWKVF